MDINTFFVILIFMFVTSSQRAFVYGRLKGEGLIGYCPVNDTIIKRDNSFARRIQQIFHKNVHKFNMECGGNTTVHPGIITKELDSTWSGDSTTKQCIFKIQAPEGYRVYVYSYSYSWVTVDRDSCVSSPNDSAALAGFYDGKIDDNTLLYSTKFADVIDITSAVSTGRELLVDLKLTAKRARLYKFRRLVIKYAFIKKDKEKVIVYGENKS